MMHTLKIIGFVAAAGILTVYGQDYSFIQPPGQYCYFVSTNQLVPSPTTSSSLLMLSASSTLSPTSSQPSTTAVQTASKSFNTRGGSTSSALPSQSVRSLAPRNSPMFLFHWIAVTLASVEAYLTTISNSIYTCVNTIAAATTVRTTTSHAPAAMTSTYTTSTSRVTSTTMRDPSTTTSSSGPADVAGTAGAAACAYNGDCPEAYLGLQYCSGGVCKSGECNNNSNCPNHRSCSNHFCF